MAAQPSPRRTAKQARSQDTVDCILTACARVLVRCGFEGTTTPLIAAEAGCSVGSLYQYFGNKEAIIEALTVRHYAQLWAIFEGGFARAAPMCLVDAVHEMIRTMVDANALNPELHALIDADVARTGAARREEVMTKKKVVQYMAAYLEAHKAELDVDDCAVSAFVIVQAADALVHKEKFDGVSPERLANELTKLVTRYLGAR